MRVIRKTILTAIVFVLAAVLCLGAACGKKDGDAAASVGTVAGLKLTRPVFAYAFGSAAQELYESGNVSFDGFGTQTFLDELTGKKDGSGKSYYEILKENVIENAVKYLVNEKLSRGDAAWPSDGDLAKEGEESLKKIETQYASYIQYYGYTVESLVMQMYGMPSADFVDIYPRTMHVGDYNDSWMEKLSPTEEELAGFYKEHEAEYRIVTVRHSLLDTKELDEAGKAEALKKAESYVDAVKNGTMTFDEVVELSEDPGVTSNDGYYDVYEGAGFVKEFLDWALARDSVTEIPEIVETEHGYHLMICTKIGGYEDETVREKLGMGWRNFQLNEMLEGLLEKDEYTLKNRNEETADSFMRMCCLMQFGEQGSSDPTGEPATPTPKPEYNDEPASADVVAKVGGSDVGYPELVYMFSSAVNDTITGVIDFGSATEVSERYEILRNLLDSKYQDTDQTYLEKIKERTLELLLEFKATHIMASETKAPFTAEELAALNDEIDQAVDYYLSYMGERYGVSTRDEYMRYVAGMNVNEYKLFNAEQKFITDYAQAEMEKIEVSDEELKAYYNESEDLYRVVSARHIYLAYSDADDNGSFSDGEKQASRDLAASIVKKLTVDGDSPEALVKAWSQADDATSSAGIVNVSANTKLFTDEISKKLLAADHIGLDTLGTYELDSGIEIIYVVGILTFDGLEGETGSTDVTHENLVSTVKAEYRNEQFEKRIRQYIADKGLKLENVDYSLLDKAAEDYMKYEKEEAENENGQE